MERNYDMLKLIVQKMEIETEADNHDEGFHTSHSLDDVINPTCSKWNSDVLRKNLIRQNAVISKWKEHSQHSNIQSTFDCWVRFWWSSGWWISYMYLNIVINFDQEQIPMCFMLDIREFSLQYCKELNCLLLNKKCRIWSYWCKLIVHWFPTSF